MNQKKIDRRFKYYLMVDVETANSGDKVDPTQSLVYDVGASIIDRNGNIYESLNAVVSEVFYDMSDVMRTAFYAKKLPQYHEGIERGEIEVMPFMKIKKLLAEWVKAYNVRAFVAHNARFDTLALNATCRYLTKSRVRYFLPYGLPVWDTLQMVNETICKEPAYKGFCEDFGYLTKQGKVRRTAEILFQYLSGNATFEESHTGLADVLIEKEIFSYCMTHHRAKNMKKELFSAKEFFPVFVKNLQGKKFKIGTNF